MSVTINGSGTVTGISVGGLPDGVITTDDIAANAVTTPKLGTDEASGLAKAWVNFNGTGTVAIRAQYNVSSITDNGTGDYTVNFTTALADANYSASASSGQNNSSQYCTTNTSTQTASALRIQNSNLAAALLDNANMFVAIFR
jgi:hypothetical protein